MRPDAFVWTDLEEGILIDAVKEAGNVKRGLKNASEVLHTSFFICRNRWYKHTQHKMLEQEEAGDLHPTVREPEIIEHRDGDTVKNMKESLEDFLGSLSNLVSENRRLSERNAYLERENRILVAENREIKEAYDYILKVIDKARKMTLEDENRPEKLKYAIKDGAVEISA